MVSKVAYFQALLSFHIIWCTLCSDGYYYDKKIIDHVHNNYVDFNEMRSKVSGQIAINQSIVAYVLFEYPSGC